MILFLTGSYFSNWVNMCQRGRVSLGPITYLINKYEQICNDCLRGKVEMKMDSEVWSSNPGEFKIVKKKLGG